MQGAARAARFTERVGLDSAGGKGRSCLILFITRWREIQIKLFDFQKLLFFPIAKKKKKKLELNSPRPRHAINFCTPTYIPTYFSSNLYSRAFTPNTPFLSPTPKKKILLSKKKKKNTWKNARRQKKKKGSTLGYEYFCVTTLHNTIST